MSAMIEGFGSNPEVLQIILSLHIPLWHGLQAFHYLQRDSQFANYYQPMLHYINYFSSLCEILLACKVAKDPNLLVSYLGNNNTCSVRRCTITFSFFHTSIKFTDFLLLYWSELCNFIPALAPSSALTY